MKYILVFVVIICLALFVGAQEEDFRDYTDDINSDPAEQEETYIPEPVPEPVQIVTRLNVTLIDDIGGHKIELENAIVQVIGELHVAGDAITYSDTFTEGDMYKMIIWIKRR